MQILFKPAYCESSYSRKIVEECDVQTKFGLHWRDGCSGITLSGVWRFGCASTVIKRWRNGGTGGALEEAARSGGLPLLQSLARLYGAFET